MDQLIAWSKSHAQFTHSCAVVLGVLIRHFWPAISAAVMAYGNKQDPPQVG